MYGLLGEQKLGLMIGSGAGQEVGQSNQSGPLRHGRGVAARIHVLSWTEELTAWGTGYWYEKATHVGHASRPKSAGLMLINDSARGI